MHVAVVSDPQLEHVADGVRDELACAFPPPAALATVSDQLCLQYVSTMLFQTCSSSTVGAYHEQDDQQEQRQRAHRHHRTAITVIYQ